MKFSEIPKTDRLTRNFTWEEFLAGHLASYLDTIKGWRLDWILRPLVVAELARGRAVG